jgi:beta-mannanase
LETAASLGRESFLRLLSLRKLRCAEQSKASAFAALLALALVSCGRNETASTSPTPPSAPPAPRNFLLPENGLYTGAYIEAGDNEDDVTLEKIEHFEDMVGKHQAIIASSSYWGEQTFPMANVQLIARHGSIPLIFWSPWDKPYLEGRGPDKYSLEAIIDGQHDAYIDRWADAAREFGRPMIVSFANEMNGSWFPWSGIHYGANAVVPGSQPPKYEGPETFKAAWRHVVDRVRARGAKNVQWVLHLMDFSMPQEKWNLATHYYPGPAYVDWLGFSLYGAQFPSDEHFPTFFSCFDWPYTELCQLDPSKPVMLCEWGVGELPDKGDKGDWIRDAFRVMQDSKKFPRLKAAVFWHERWQNSAEGDTADRENAFKYSDLRVNSSPGSLKAYQDGVRPAFFVDQVRWAE